MNWVNPVISYSRGESAQAVAGFNEPGYNILRRRPRRWPRDASQTRLLFLRRLCELITSRVSSTPPRRSAFAGSCRQSGASCFPLVSKPGSLGTRGKLTRVSAPTDWTARNGRRWEGSSTWFMTGRREPSKASSSPFSVATPTLATVSLTWIRFASRTSPGR